MKKKLFVFLAGFAASMLLSACSEEIAYHTALVVSNTSNQPALDAESVAEQIEPYVGTKGATVSIFVADGQPYQYGDTAKIEQGMGLYDEQTKERVLKSNALAVAQAVQAAQAKTPESDLLSALTMAGRSLAGYDDGSKLMVVYGSGLSTSGLLDMTQLDIQTADAQEIVSQLKEYKALPNLEGVSVVWYNLSDVSGEQPDLTPAMKSNLEEFYRLFLTEAGAASVEFSDDLPSGAANEGLPYVSIVPVQEISLGSVVKLDEATIQFEPDSAYLTDKQAAVDALTPLAEALKADPQAHYLIAGSTAAADAALEQTQRFALQRAEAIRTLLLELGVKPNQLSVCGVGMAQTSVRSDNDPENRCAWLVNTTDALAQELLSVGITETN